MRKIRIEILIAAVVLLPLFSCGKSTHSVYFKVTGTSDSTQIIYGEGASISVAQGSGSKTITVTSLPWTSPTYSVSSSQSEVFYLNVCYEGNKPSNQNITIAIYDNGTEETSSNCDTASCLCQQVEYAAN